MRKLLFLLAFLPVMAGAMDKIAEVPHSSTSVILRIDLYDAAAPEQCASDVTVSTSGLQINVSSDVTNGYYDQYQQSDSTLEAITTIGTYETPTATKARFEIIASGACTYELQLPDAAFAVSNANFLTIAVTDGGTEIIDQVYRVDLTPIEAATLVDLIWDESTVGHTGAGTFGEQLKTDVDAILVDTGTTLPSTLSTIQEYASRSFIYTATIDTVTSQTQLEVDVLDDPGADNYHIGQVLCVEDSDDDSAQDCAEITDFDSANDRWTIANALSFTVEVGDQIWIRPPVSVSVISSDAGADVWNVTCEDQGTSYTCREIVSVLLSEAAGACTYNSTTRVWTCNDPGGNEVRLVITMGTDLDGDRDSVTLTPMTP